MPASMGDIGGETVEDAQRHRAEFRKFAEEEADFRASAEWRDMNQWIGPILALWILACPALWVLWVFITRGGLVLYFSGMSLVNTRGQRASRLRCAWRTLLIWLPIAVLLLAALELEIWYWDDWQPGDPRIWVPWAFWACWWAALALLLSYPVLALWFPVRGPHDRLAATCLVPR